MAYIKKKDLISTFNATEEYAQQFHDSYDEFERLGENRLPEDLDDSTPAVTDGSLSALILEIAMRQLKQLQTGKVTSLDRDEPWLIELANIYWTRYIIPRANAQSSFFNKFFNGILRSLWYGSQPFYSFFASRDDYTGGDFSLPYVRDVYLEKGKVSDKDSNHIFMKQYFTELQIDTIIAETVREEKLAKKENRKSDSMWNVAALRRLKAEHAKGGKAKDQKNKNSSEREQRVEASFITIVRLFQKGYKAPCYAFAPELGKDDENNGCIGEYVNKNPTGDMPVSYIYALEDLTCPYGRGLVAMGGHVQNILDGLVQDHVLATSVGLRPITRVKGDLENSSVNLDSIVIEPDGLWEVGDADVDLVKTTNEVYSQFSTTYGLYKTLLLNILGISDATGSSESGNPQYSKTDAGVEMQRERTSIHESFLSQRADEAFARLARILLNITFASTNGSTVIRLLDDEIERMRSAGIKMPETRELEVLWDRARGSFDFDVDPNSSKGENDKAKGEAVAETIKEYVEMPTLEAALARDGWKLSIGKLYKQRLMNKIPNWEDVLTPLTAEGSDNMTGGAATTDDAENPQQLMAELQQTMQQYEGLDDAGARQVMGYRREGYSEEQIANEIIPYLMGATV